MRDIEHDIDWMSLEVDAEGHERRWGELSTDENPTIGIDAPSEFTFDEYYDWIYTRSKLRSESACNLTPGAFCLDKNLTPQDRDFLLELMIHSDNGTLGQFLDDLRHSDRVKHLGGGCFSSVLSIDGLSFVLKNEHQKDTGAETWMYEAMSHPEQAPGLPKVSMITYQGNRMITLLERLSTADNVRTSKNHSERISLSVYKHSARLNLRDCYFDYGNYTGEQLQKFKQIFTSLRYNVIQRLARLADFRKGISRNKPLDLHKHNLMYRGEQVVITDPLT